MSFSVQFTSLKSFVPRFAHPQRANLNRRAVPIPQAVAVNTAALQGGTQQIQLPRGECATSHRKGYADLQDLPPFHEWHQREDLLQGCEPDSPRPLNVAVLLSGGVDSSLALQLVKAAGHNVTAFYLKIWFHEDFRNFWEACPWEKDLAYCKQVCQQLDVPLKVVPLTTQYWDRVVTHCIGEIRQGRTPNPDVLCNSRVKFGAFYEHLEQAYTPRFDRIASGHYARLERPQPHVANGGASSWRSSQRTAELQQQLGPAAGATAGGQRAERAASPPVLLALTPDAVKDQTYFLAHLSQEQLGRSMFPLGHLTKGQVRRLAAATGLPTQDRKDSQGICFLGKVKFNEFLKEHLGVWAGPFVEEETNEVVGYHRGFWFYTVGQRKGVSLAEGPWYVTRKDPHSNAVYISRHYFQQGTVRGDFSCAGFNWIAGEPPPGDVQLHCKVRHGPQMYTCSLQLVEDGATGRVVLDDNDHGLATGQYAVFYHKGYCLGSAVITATD